MKTPFPSSPLLLSPVAGRTAGLALGLVLLGAGPLLAQTAPATGTTAAKATGRLTGAVQDAATKKPVEFATVALLAAGADGVVKDAARALHLATGTVRNHLTAAAAKLGARGRVEAYRLARDHGWI